MGNRPVAARWGVRLGATLMELNKPQRAAEAYCRAQQLARSLNDPMLDQRILGGLGVAYTQLDRPADAIENLMEANEIAKEVGDLPKQAEWLASIGQALFNSINRKMRSPRSARVDHRPAGRRCSAAGRSADIDGRNLR